MMMMVMMVDWLVREDVVMVDVIVAQRQVWGE